MRQHINFDHGGSMANSMPTKKKFSIKECETEEAMLQFKHFSNYDALSVGKMLINASLIRQVNPAFEIVINGFTVFRFAFPLTNRLNDIWLKKKCNTVNTVHMSSLHLGLLLQSNNEELEKDWGLTSTEYATIGGGFPIIIKNTGVIGSVCASGLAHEEDHQLVVDTLKQYLECC